MPAEYEMTLADYLEAQKLHARWAQRDIRRRNMIWGLMLVAATIAFFIEQYALAVGLLGGIAGSYLLPAFWNALIVPAYSRIKYRNLTEVQRNQALDLEDSGLRFGKAPRLIRWSEFKKWKENGSYVLAYIDRNVFIVIPERIVDQGFDVTGIKAKLSSEVGNAT